eukprot:Skav222978  [mRNA]  locus=scaffold2762:26211:28049:+ [translate_table: standard]
MMESADPSTNSGLMGKLQNEWEQKHQIYYHAKAPELPSKTSPEGRHVFRGKVCLGLGICACQGIGQAAYVFWQKMSKMFRARFKKKTQDRNKLTSALCVLSLDGPAGPILFHIGYCNFKTYHFSVLAMQKRGEPFHFQGRWLQPLALLTQEIGRHAFDLALHAFARLDLNSTWKGRICELVLRPQHFLDIQQMHPHHVEIYADDDSPPCFVWEGWEAEKAKLREKRRHRGPPKKNTNPHDRSGGQISDSRKRPQSEHQEEIEDAETLNPELFDDTAANDAGSDGYSPSIANSADFRGRRFDPSESEGQLTDPEPGSDVDTENEHSGEDSDGSGCNEWVKAAGQWLDLAAAEGLFEADVPGNDDDDDIPGATETAAAATTATEEIGNAAATTTTGTASAGDVPHPERNLMSEFNAVDSVDVAASSEQPASNHVQDEDSASVATSDVSITSSSQLFGSDHDASNSSSDSSDSDELPQRDPNSEGGKLGGPRVEKVADDRFDVPNGSIRYNFRASNLVAHCSVHDDNCRRTRTVNPAANSRRSGQGRPVGLLMSWLDQAHKFKSAKEHSSGCKPSHEERVAARRRFNRMKGGLEFSKKYERKQFEGEDEEPDKMT